VNELTEDSVPRLQRFRREHPEIVITPPDKSSAFWEAFDEDGKRLAYGYWLKILLDKLDALVDQS
jgi:hypothetical protein